MFLRHSPKDSSLSHKELSHPTTYIINSQLRTLVSISELECRKGRVELRMTKGSFTIREFTVY